MIEFINVSKRYKTGDEALIDLNLRINDGEFVFIVGPSGSGKTTLLKLLTRELQETSGEIWVDDTELGKLKRRHIPAYRRRLGVVFQDFRLLEDRNIYDNIAFAQLITGKSDAEIAANTEMILREVGMSGKEDHFPGELSGGEQQRAAIARALVNRPEILLADEPTGNLDRKNAEDIMALLENINRQGTTVIVITHDRQLVSRMHKRVVTIQEGEVIYDDDPGNTGFRAFGLGAELEAYKKERAAEERLREADAAEESIPEEVPVRPERRRGERRRSTEPWYGEERRKGTDRRRSAEAAVQGTDRRQMTEAAVQGTDRRQMTEAAVQGTDRRQMAEAAVQETAKRSGGLRSRARSPHGGDSTLKGGRT